MSSKTKRKSVANQYETGSATKRSTTPENILENPTIYSIPLPAGGGTTGSNIIGQEAPAYRSISVKNLSLPPDDQINEVENYLKNPYSFKCPKSDGTPQKRLLYLAKACIEIINNKIYTYKAFTKDENTLNEQLIRFMEGQKEDETAERNWWSGESENKQHLNKLINKVLTKPAKLYNATYESIIISLHLIILGKSYSDISQMGQLINYISKLNASGGTQLGSIFNIINNDAKVAFISSDKICAGVSSLIIDSLPFPFETLCTRKSSEGHKNVQNIIVQKGIIATLSVLLGLIETSTDLNEILEIFPYDNVIRELLTIYKKYLITLKGVTTIDMEYNNLYDLRKKLEKDENPFLVYDSNQKLINLSTFINEIKNVIITEDNLDKLSTCRNTLFQQKLNHTSPRWTYYVANDVFRLLNPQNQLLNPQNQSGFDQLKKNISYYEFLCATIDGTYGHDFHGLNCVELIGEFFWNIAGFPVELKIENGPKNEDEAIKRCLKHSNCVTIDQHEDELVYNFNYENNFLISDTNLGNPKNWHFFDSLFSLKPLILAVDFTKGIQTELVEKASATFSMKQQKIAEKSKKLINPLNPNELQDEVLLLFEQSGIGKELNGACTIFDGAAPYGLFPLYITDDTEKIETYTSEIVIERRDAKFQLQISTQSNLTKKILDKKYINSIIQTRESPTSQIFDVLKDEPFNIRDDYNNFIHNVETLDKGTKFIELYAKLLNSRINNGKLKLGKKELFSFIKGCKIFIAIKKKERGEFPTILNNIDYLTNNVISSATADILKDVFIKILANIIDTLYYSQKSKEDEDILLELFEYGVDFEYVEGEKIYGLSEKETTEKSTTDNETQELFRDIRRSQLLTPRHYFEGKVPILSSGVSPLPSSQGIKTAVTVQPKAYGIKPDMRGWISGYGVGTVDSLQNKRKASFTSDLKTPLTDRTITDTRTPPTTNVAILPANLATTEMITPVSSNSTTTTTTTTEAVKGFDSFYHNTPGNTQDLIETQIDSPIVKGSQSSQQYQEIYSSPATRGDNFYPNSPIINSQQSQEQATYISPSSSQNQQQLYSSPVGRGDIFSPTTSNPSSQQNQAPPTYTSEPRSQNLPKYWFSGGKNPKRRTKNKKNKNQNKKTKRVF